MSKYNGYTAHSERTKRFCKEIGFIFDIHFVATFKRKDKLFVRPTLGKPGEFDQLQRACERIKTFEGLEVVYTGRRPRWA